MNTLIRTFFLLFLVFFMTKTYAEDDYFNNLEYQLITARENAERTPLEACSSAVNVAWKASNEFLSLIPGVGDLAKMFIGMSKLNNVLLCSSNGSEILTLAHMNDVATQVANQVVDDALRKQLEDQGTVLLIDLSKKMSLMEIYNKLSDQEKADLITGLNTIGVNAALVEAKAKSLSFNTLPSLTVISSNKLGALALRHQLTGQHSSTRERRAQDVRDEARNTLDIINNKEHQLNTYINGVVESHWVNNDLFSGAFGEYSETYHSSIKDNTGKELWHTSSQCHYSGSQIKSDGSHCSARSRVPEAGRRKLQEIRQDIHNRVLPPDYNTFKQQITHYTRYFVYHKLQNRWLEDQQIHIENGSLQTGAVEPGWWSAHWVFEQGYGDNIFRIRNRWKLDQYLNIQNGSLTSGSIEPGWHSAQWIFEPVPGTDYIRMKNLWKPEQYIHIEYGSLTSGPIQPGWWSAQWKTQ